MIGDDVLRAINPTEGVYKAFWIKPDGSILICEPLNHFAVLGPQVIERFNELYELAREEAEEWAESFEPGEHIPWHCVDENSQASSALLRELSGEGYIRCATMMAPWGKIFELQTSNETIKAHTDLISYIRAALDIEKAYFIDAITYRRTKLK